MYDPVTFSSLYITKVLFSDIQLLFNKITQIICVPTYIVF